MSFFWFSVGCIFGALLLDAFVLLQACIRNRERLNFGEITDWSRETGLTYVPKIFQTRLTKSRINLLAGACVQTLLFARMGIIFVTAPNHVLTEKESRLRRALIAHELAHIALGHQKYKCYLLTLGSGFCFAIWYSWGFLYALVPIYAVFKLTGLRRIKSEILADQFASKLVGVESVLLLLNTVKSQLVELMAFEQVSISTILELDRRIVALQSDSQNRP